MLGSVAARADVVVNISKSQQRLAVVVDGAEAYRWPVSTGRRGYTTPSGVFHPERLERHWYSRKYENSPMPWSVFFHRGYAVHGTMEAYHLGRAASHGCVRLRPDHARTLFGLVRRAGFNHTKIVVLDGPLPHLRPAPHGAPMVEAEPPRAAEAHFARALDRLDAQPHASEHLSARTHPVTVAPPPAREPVRYSLSRGSDEARVLREREAWLHSIDRRYGIVR
ncbi:MAG TPA: L,D-transpeptidase [Pseudolabrys sp.]|nr:L,D-transpeptidase [Pseudolabrys sp.]